LTSPTAAWNELHLAEEPAVDLLQKLGYTYVPKESLMHVLLTEQVRVGAGRHSLKEPRP
jgi:hypothetical protein